MPHSTDRRAFIAVTAFAIPVLAGARVSASSFTTKDDESTDFQDHMTEAKRSLEHIRRPMRSIDDPESRANAAMLANAMTIHLANAAKFADQAHAPAHAKHTGAEDHERFVNELRLELTRSVSAANALSRQLWLGNTAEPNRIFEDVQFNINRILERSINDG